MCLCQKRSGSLNSVVHIWNAKYCFDKSSKNKKQERHLKSLPLKSGMRLAFERNLPLRGSTNKLTLPRAGQFAKLSLSDFSCYALWSIAAIKEAFLSRTSVTYLVNVFIGGGSLPLVINNDSGHSWSKSQLLTPFCQTSDSHLPKRY